MKLKSCFLQCINNPEEITGIKYYWPDCTRNVAGFTRGRLSESGSILIDTDDCLNIEDNN